MPEAAANDPHASGWTVGHRATGARPFAMFAGGTPARGWVGAGPDAHRLAHGVTSAGLVVALDGDPDLPMVEGLVSRLLESAGDAATAGELLTTEWGGKRLELPRPVVSVISGGTGWSFELGGGESSPQPLTTGTGERDTSVRIGLWQGHRELYSGDARLQGSTRIGNSAQRSVLLAGRGRDGPPIILLGLGSPSSAILIRLWPGHVVAPPVGTIASVPSRLGELAADVDALIARGVLTEAAVQSAVAGARAAALAEGDHAEHQAQLMDSQGDDSGAAVRRLVAQSHAGSLAEAALVAVLERASGEASL